MLSLFSVLSFLFTVALTCVYADIAEPAPPSLFEGSFQKCKFLNRTEYCLKTRWQAADSLDVLFYRIYLGEEVIATIPAEGPLEYKTCVSSKRNMGAFEVTAVYADALESAPIALQLIVD